MILWIIIAILLLAGIGAFGWMWRRTKRLPTLSGTLALPPVAPDAAQRAGDSLSLLIRCPTVTVKTPDGDYLAFTALRRLLQHRYPNVFRVMTVDTVNTHSLTLHWRGSKPNAEPLLFLAHQDVVPAGDGWDANPFGGEKHNGNVYGRGALDVKGVLVCLLEAAEALIQEDFTPENDIWFAFGHDEEIGGTDGATAIAERFARRGLRFAMVLDEGGFIMRKNGPYIAHVGMAEKGLMNLALTVHDLGGHASLPTQHTTIGRLAEAISRIESCQAKPKLTPLARDYLFAVAATLTGKQRFMLANHRFFGKWLMKSLLQEPYYNAMLRTTAAPTIVRGGDTHNVLPQVADANINVRLLTGEPGRHYHAYTQRLTQDCRVDITVARLQEAGMVSDYKDRIFSRFAHVVRDTFGPITVAPFLMYGATDASHYEPLCRHVYRFCPFAVSQEQHATIHAANEYVSENALGVAVQFYRSLMTQSW